MKETNTLLAPELEAARGQFESWRSSKRRTREPIPQSLWETAIALTRKHSITEVSKCLGLNFTDLKKRVSGAGCISRREPDTFIEVSFDNPLTPSECIVEMEDKSGCRMKMCFRGETRLDLLELGKAFLQRKR